MSDTEASPNGETGAHRRSSDPALVFVGGCDRSGTTVVGRLLAERANLVVLPEAYFHAVAYRRFGAAASAADGLRHWRRRSWHLASGDPFGDDRPLADLVRRRMADSYESARGVRDPLRVVESTPENIEIGSILLSEFPDSRIIHLVRDPRAVVASLRWADFGPNSAQECARFWKQRVASGLALELNHPDRVTRLRFEDLLTDGSVLEPFAMLLGNDERFSFVADRDFQLDHTSQALQKRSQQEADPSHADAWRSILSPAEIGTVEYECRELMLAFGYELDGVTDGRSSTRRRLNATRSAVAEFTVGYPRRALRIVKAGVSSRQKPLRPGSSPKR